MGDTSSSDEEPPAAIPEPDVNDWDILAALRRRGQYPTWDLEWLQKLLEDKIHHLANKVEVMQRNNDKVEKSVLSRLASLKDFKRILKEHLSEFSEAEKNKIR